MSAERVGGRGDGRDDGEGSELAGLLERAGLGGASLERLAGDASTRRYLRATSGDDSAVLVVHPDPLPEPSGDVDPWSFARWTAFYRELGVRVPAILAEDRHAGLALLEDLGDTLLEDELVARGPSACLALYEEAVEIATVIAEEGTRRFEPDADDSDDPLVARRLAWEMDFLLRHSQGLDEDALAEARGALGDARVLLHRLCDDAHAASPEGSDSRSVSPSRAPSPMPSLALCHRDFHARNLLVLDEDGRRRLAVIDHQDTRRGPRAYDVASLVFDPYVDLPDADRAALVERARPADRTSDAWRLEVDLTAAQRLLKAAGSFAWLSGARGLARYEQWLPVALARAGERLEAARWSGTADLARALAACDVPLQIRP